MGIDREVSENQNTNLENNEKFKYFLSPSIERAKETENVPSELHRNNSINSVDLRPGWVKKFDCTYQSCYYVNSNKNIVTFSSSLAATDKSVEQSKNEINGDGDSLYDDCLTDQNKIEFCNFRHSNGEKKMKKSSNLQNFIPTSTQFEINSEHSGSDEDDCFGKRDTDNIKDTEKELKDKNDQSSTSLNGIKKIKSISVLSMNSRTATPPTIKKNEGTTVKKELSEERIAQFPNATLLKIKLMDFPEGVIKRSQLFPSTKKSEAMTARLIAEVNKMREELQMGWDREDRAFLSNSEKEFSHFANEALRESSECIAIINKQHEAKRKLAKKIGQSWALPDMEVQFAEEILQARLNMKPKHDKILKNLESSMLETRTQILTKFIKLKMNGEKEIATKFQELELKEVSRCEAREIAEQEKIHKQDTLEIKKKLKLNKKMEKETSLLLDKQKQQTQELLDSQKSRILALKKTYTTTLEQANDFYTDQLTKAETRYSNKTEEQ
eukprot:Pgem_evm1s2339